MRSILHRPTPAPARDSGRRPGRAGLGGLLLLLLGACTWREQAIAEVDPNAPLGAAPVLDTGACPPLPDGPPPWTEWPIQWDAERARLTMAYLAHHRGSDRVTGDPAIDTVMEPKMIVLHWTAGPTAKSAWYTFDPVKVSSRRKLGEHQLVNLSAHFVVDRDGTAYRLLDETLVGRHTIGLNHLAIGIENVGDGRRWPLTEAQKDTNVRLVRWLAAHHPITHLIGHREYRLFEGHPYFEETDPGFRTHREDPGVDFLEAVRREVADLGLHGPYGPPPVPRRPSVTVLDGGGPAGEDTGSQAGADTRESQQP